MPNVPNYRLVAANIYIGDRRTSIKMEPEIWECLARVCDMTKLSVDQLISFLAYQHPGANLTSLIRSYVAHLLLERLEQPLMITPFSLSQFKGVRRAGGVLRLIEADKAKAV